MERAAEERHEYIDGQIYAMAGESAEHADITVNLVASLVNQLKGSSCRVRSKDTKVRSGPDPKPRHGSSGLFSYPDLVVICGEPLYHDAVADVVLNPTAIIEVLSPATESFDRGEKFKRYQLWNKSLKDYLLVSQDCPQIEHYEKQGQESWIYNRTEGLEASVVIQSINCKLTLLDVYDRISFLQE